MKRSDVLYTADSLINGDRQNDYGEAYESFEAIGRMWSAYLGVDVAPHDVAHMMCLLKIARLRNGPHTDSSVDVCGYAALGCELSDE